MTKGWTGLADLVSAIDDAIANGEGRLRPAALVQEFERRGWRLFDDRDPADATPNGEDLAEIIVDAYSDTIMHGVGNFHESKFAYELKRHDLILVDRAASSCGDGCTCPAQCQSPARNHF